MKVEGTARRLLLQGSVLIVVLLLYCWPALRTRAELGSALPPAFAPDLSMYIALSSPPTADMHETQNPYYLVPVAQLSTGYLRFRLAPWLFSKVRAQVPGRLWMCVFVWNLLCWAALGVLATYFFDRSLPRRQLELVVLGVALFMLFNFSSLRPLFFAWLHLPSLAGFRTIELPFMRAFIPVMPTILLMSYLILQIEALRKKGEALTIWMIMAVLQFLALAMFPYATLMMAGLTAIAVLGGRYLFVKRNAFLTVVAYGIVCGIIDAAFAMSGPLGFYNEHSSSPIHFQPSLLPHLIGGNFLLLGLLVLAVALGRDIESEVKWPLIGLGVSNLLLLLGDAVIPAKSVLLSHHAGYFVSPVTSILILFALLAAYPGMQAGASIPGRVAVVVAVAVILTGFLVSVGLYRSWRPYNKQTSELAELRAGSLKPEEGDLVIARSRDVDDSCGWIFLLFKAPVLYCTDAQVMLTPQQNLEVHRFREAIYLYLTGEDRVTLDQRLRGPKRLDTLYSLGYWAEAVSPSPAEQDEGVQAAENQIAPWLERIEHGDPAVGEFFRGFRRIVVIDDIERPTFVQTRLASLLKSQAGLQRANLKVEVFVPK